MGIFTKGVSEKRSRKSRKVHWTIFIIFVVALLATFLNYPIIWDKGIGWLNYKVGLEVLPNFYNRPFKLGLDLQGGTHLVYQADLSNIDPGDYMDSMQGVRDVIERRINIFGVAEPVVQVNKVGSNYRLIVELAGVKDVSQAIAMIGQTPSLDFREERPKSETENILAEREEIGKKLEQGITITPDEEMLLLEDPFFTPTQLTGRYLKGAQLGFDQQTYQSQVNLQFDDEGSKLFEELTRKNTGQRLAIYLDGVAIARQWFRKQSLAVKLKLLVILI